MGSERGHSGLSASGASRWMHCPGSVALTRDIEGENSTYAQEGSTAHLLGELCLRQEISANNFLGQVLGETPVTASMVAAVQVYLDTCRRLSDACDLLFVEKQFDLAPLKPPVPMYGTCDFAAYSTKRRELHIVDLKFGRGVWVSAKNNPQLLYYALGAALEIGEPVSTASMTVCQPRFGKGDPVRSAAVDAIELAEFSFDLMDRARATQEPDAPTVAGAWCKFCPVKNSCPSHRNAKAEAAFREFSLADDRAAGT